ncbi:hypothetical protein CERZMDRAFT_102252 [Cercospora zeae-maydis SCOH1-5]|uniref:Uncharacterized protein n=1 Tax=Cercospora zeae-maydis SCOH1-5 TaxID=717836 RepID=A0A6A6F2X3_9PEZI|nr:hypothetical protein CERZMDRAFT_102252 [Cercospora zeae-maydis SCOH1-5]
MINAPYWLAGRGYEGLYMDYGDENGSSAFVHEVQATTYSCADGATKSGAYWVQMAMEPDATRTDAVQTAFNLLSTMASSATTASDAPTSTTTAALHNNPEHGWTLPSPIFQDNAVPPGDPLGNPFIEDFLAGKAFEWPSGPLLEQDMLRQFTHELGDELIFF